MPACDGLTITQVAMSCPWVGVDPWVELGRDFFQFSVGWAVFGPL